MLRKRKHGQCTFFSPGTDPRPRGLALSKVSPHPWRTDPRPRGLALSKVSMPQTLWLGNVLCVLLLRITSCAWKANIRRRLHISGKTFPSRSSALSQVSTHPWRTLPLIKRMGGVPVGRVDGRAGRRGGYGQLEGRQAGRSGAGWAERGRTQTNGRMVGCTHGRMDGRMDGWADGRAI